jgi:hypothetical protein
VRDRPQAETAPLARSPCRGDRFPRSMQEPEPSSRHLHAGRHLGSRQAPPRLVPGLQSIPGFDVTFLFRHVISGSLSLAFLAHTCRAQRRDFPATLTTTALDRSSSRWFAASACTAAAEGHQDTNARLLHLLHSTESSDLILYIQPPSTFVAHQWTRCERQRRRSARFRKCAKAAMRHGCAGGCCSRSCSDGVQSGAQSERNWPRLQPSRSPLFAARSRPRQPDRFGRRRHFFAFWAFFHAS